jgi:hypothetical protein
MRMTRHPGRSSFTFEIKRASRLSPEVLTPRKTSFPASPSLAEQVFGKFSGPPTAPQSPRFVVPNLDRLPNSREMRAGTEASKATPRRVLPDLLSSHLDPVEERLREVSEERAVRRRAVREVGMMGVDRRTSEEPPQATPEPSAVDTHFDKGSADTSLEVDRKSVPDESPMSADAEAVQRETGTRAARKLGRLRAASRRATKQGLPQPRLPAGSRWKRRLPWTCW